MTRSAKSLQLYPDMTYIDSQARLEPLVIGIAAHDVKASKIPHRRPGRRSSRLMRFASEAGASRRAATAAERARATAPDLRAAAAAGAE